MKAPAECETWTYWWIVKWSGPQPLASIWVWSWDPLRFARRHPPHHLSPAGQTTRQGVILWGASAAPQPAQQRSDQGRKPVISEQIVAGRAKILPSLSWVRRGMRMAPARLQEGRWCGFRPSAVMSRKTVSDSWARQRLEHLNET